MAKITREEVLKLAELSRIEILEEEIDSITKQLQDVLSYAERVTQLASEKEVEFDKNVNVFAQDIIRKTNPAPIIAQSPEHEDNFFVVPKIIEDK
jgi:aspartyl-tRNA(Asn)/glutamyl-tRNA(Gln) amidotransferase subunit C